MVLKVVLAAIAVLASAAAQNSAFARPGLIHYIEGQVIFGAQPITSKAGEFYRMDSGDTLSTKQGRAEVLLTPGAFLRLAENSSFKLVSPSEHEILSGIAIIEIDDLPDEARLTFRMANSEITPTKRGLYRLEFPSRVQVYDGDVRTNGSIEVQKGREPKDALYLWTARRAMYIDRANVASAVEARGETGFQPGWVWNPWYGMFTWVPKSGFGYSPFNWPIYSADTVRTIAPPPEPGLTIHLP